MNNKRQRLIAENLSYGLDFKLQKAHIRPLVSKRNLAFETDQKFMPLFIAVINASITQLIF